MVEGLDMTLDDIIKKNQKSKANNSEFGGSGRGSSSNGVHGRSGRLGEGRGHVHGPGPARLFLGRRPFRMMPYRMQQGLHVRGMGMVGGASNDNAGTTLHVSNLSYSVTHRDIKLLFSDVGELKRYAVHYDGSGRPKGTAEVVFGQHSDALAAIRMYNNRFLDGRRMKIVLMDPDFVTSAMTPAIPDMGPQRGAYERGDQLLRVQGRGQKRGQFQVSAEALDADLEKYHEEARQIQ